MTCCAGLVGGALSAAELARRKGMRPVESLDGVARDVFASDEELDNFLEFGYAGR